MGLNDRIKEIINQVCKDMIETLSDKYFEYKKIELEAREKLFYITMAIFGIVFTCWALLEWFDKI